MQILRSDKLRGFKVDIETDSTIRARADEEQKNRVDLITAVTGFLEKALPAVQQGMIPKKVAGELMMFGVRAFPAGPQLEEVLDDWMFGGAMGEARHSRARTPPRKRRRPKCRRSAARQRDARHREADRHRQHGEGQGHGVPGDHQGRGTWSPGCSSTC
jgi:hypothetical protein